MTESDAIALAKAYAAQWSVLWHHVVKTEKDRVWRYFSVEWYSFTIDTGDGRVDASIHVESGTVNRFEYYPSDPKAHLLPFVGRVSDVYFGHNGLATVVRRAIQIHVARVLPKSIGGSQGRVPPEVSAANG